MVQAPGNPVRRRWLAGGAGLTLSAMTGCAVTGGPSITGADGAAPLATVTQGQLQGRRQSGVLSFLRVPYAADPFVAQRRFRAPEPMPAWTGVRDAGAYGPMPPQPSRTPGGGLAGGADDLTLNVWAPPDAQGAPVLVWLPGGAFYRVDAAETWYDGSAFARQGIVVVTVNYRVGIDGFMWFDDRPANRGLLDQVAALRWVRQNIAVFGGDPNRVTLAGQSAGAQSVMLLMGMPDAQGLFQRAIAQSPPVNHLQPDQARQVTRATAGLLKVEPTAAGFAGVPMAELIAGTEAAVADLRDVAKWGAIGGQPPFLPVIDGQVLMDGPLPSLRRHGRPGVPLLIGCTDEEARLYLVPGGTIDRLPAPAVMGSLQRFGLPADAQAVYRDARPNASAGDMLAAIESDKTFRIPALRYAEDRVKAGSPVWYYHFGWPSPAFGGRLGAAHVVDVPYVFDTLASEQARPFLGGAGLPALATDMNARWAAFIKGSEPGWPRYDLQNRPTMWFGIDSRVIADPLSARRQVWAGKLSD